jgi:hypothetical protein
MRIFAGVFRISTILAIAVLTTTATRAQRDHDSVDRESCADVKPPVIDPAETISNVPVYIIPPGESGRRAVCRATEALTEGMVDFELRDDAVLADALGDPGPDTVTGEVSEFPYLAPDSGPIPDPPIPGLPATGPSPEVAERHHAYAAFIDPDTGVEYTFSSVAEREADAEAAAVEWITSTVKPMLEHHASNAIALPAAEAALATTDATAAAATATVVSAAITADPPPSFNPLAWKLMIDATIAMPNNKPARGDVREFNRVFDTELGSSGARVRVYRLNATLAENEYFLVDTAYTQSPDYTPFPISAFPSVVVSTWANKRTVFTLTGKDPNHPETQVSLDQFAPQTVVSSSTVTFSVGGNLTVNAKGPSGSVSADYTVTREQLDVETLLKATIGANNLMWTDTYDTGGLFQKPPATLINTFTGERLAIFKVPRTVNDNIPQGKLAGVNFAPNLESNVFGFVTTQLISISNREIFATWGIASLLFVPEPKFSASTKAVTVSRSTNSISKPVFVDIVAQLPGGDQKVAWQVTNPLSSIAAVASVSNGSGKIAIYPTSAASGETAGTISVDSSPSGATDSLRNGPIKIDVTIVP